VRALEAGADDFLAKPVDRTELTARVRSLLRLKSLYDELDDAEAVIFALAKAVEAKDHYTEAHTERVAYNAQALALIAGLPEADLRQLYRGAMVHDIGKIGVPDAILLKPGPLNDEEWEAMKKHPTIGERIARPLRSATGMLPIIRNHHERVDGLGYPDAMHGDRIPLAARIVAICDAYDAMTSDRPYRPGRAAAEAAAILRDGAGSQWDEELVHLFLDQVEREVG
jgi:putative two-component system response regulator